MKVIKDYYKQEDLDEGRKLIRVTALYDTKSFTMTTPKNVKVFRGTPEQFTKFLRQIKASDNKTQPRSKRQIRYQDITNEIINGHDIYFWVWDYRWKAVPTLVRND